MGDNCKRKKSAEQKLWEQRKLKMAGIKTEKIHEIMDEDKIILEIRDEYKSKIVNNVIDDIFDFNNPLYIIGNKPSIFYEKYRDMNLFKIPNCKVEENKLPNFNIRDLPVYKYKDEFLEKFESNNIILVTGETGCGKSTLIPKFIYDKYKNRICVTQPRILSVKSLYSRMKHFYNSEIGYAVRFDQNVSQDTKIKYVTEGILLREISSDTLLSKYDVIICDEVHERSINLDIILGYLKIILEKRTDLKIILMSATLQIEQFTQHFKCSTFHFDGNQFPVDIKYLPINVDDYIEWTAKKILNVHFKEDRGDILVFLSGKEDITQIYNILKTELKEKNSSDNKLDSNNNFVDLEIIPLYSEIMNDVYDLIFKKTSINRKCILSTNVAEASVTIPNIKYVIDTGFQKLSYYDYNQGERLIKYPISKENAIQRSGRAGRIMPGVCYRMYTEVSYKKDLRDTNIPDILRSNISTTILLLLSTNYKQIEDFPFISKPTSNVLNAGIDTLLTLGCIDNGYNITQEGLDILKIGMDIVLCKLIIEGIKHNCSSDAILLASILSLDIINILEHFLKLIGQSEFTKCKVEDNEFLTLINIYKWGTKNLPLDTFILKKVRHVQDNLLKRIRLLNHKITYSDNINTAIIKTFFFNLCIRVGRDYRKLSTNLNYKLYNSDVDGKYILYYKSFKSKKNDYLLQLSCVVKAEDVLINLGKIFKIKDEPEGKEFRLKINIFEKLYDRFILESDEED